MAAVAVPVWVSLGSLALREPSGPILGVRADAAVVSPNRGFIAKPPGLVSAPAERRQPFTYTVADGDVLGAVAEKYGLRIDTLRSTNNIDNVDVLAIGQQLLIPPTNGVMVHAGPGDTVTKLAATYHLDAQAIIEYNLIRTPDHIDPGTLVMLPDGTGLVSAQPSDVQAADSRPSDPSAIPFGGSSYNNFPRGQCTWWVASKRNIPWNGNAWSWFGNAQSAGRATGRQPRVGAIMVTWENRFYGHVALVEAVHGDGSWTVSEMNYRGLGVVDRRRIGTGQVPLIGFIY
jgi:surface antigen